MYKNTALSKGNAADQTMSLVDSTSTDEAIAAETLRLGELGVTRVVFRDQVMLDQWRARVAAGESLRLRQH